MQTVKDFEWLVIDDGSNDETQELIGGWVREQKEFPVRYFKVEHGGKQRAINRGVTVASGEYFFIVDSDDFLVADAVAFLLEAFSSLPSDRNIIGISGLKGDVSGKPLGNGPKIGENEWVDATNLERAKYDLSADMAECFFTEKLKSYPFSVWEGESFTPEAVVWDRMALDGYRLRWYGKVIYHCEYQPDGLTNSSWRLLRDNPMGYAMLFNTKLESAKDIRRKIELIIHFISCCCLAREYGYVLKCIHPVFAVLFFPVGYLLSLRREGQFKQYLNIEKGSVHH